jgi:hypothetical protein
MSKITAVAVLQTKVTTESASGATTTLQFSADYQDERNKQWAAYTPSLNLQMSVRPDVADLFDLQGRYLLSFEKQE